MTGAVAADEELLKLTLGEDKALPAIVITVSAIVVRAAKSVTLKFAAYVPALEYLFIIEP